MLYQKLNAFAEKLRKVSMGVIVGMGTIMLLITCIHIFFRYVLNNSLTWSDEFLRTSLVWFGMLSMSTLSANKDHVAITIFKSKFPEKMREVATIIVQYVIVIAVVTVFLLGIKLVLSAGSRVTPSMNLPYQFTYCAVPLGFALVSIYEIRNLVGILTGHIQENEEEGSLEKLT